MMERYGRNEDGGGRHDVGLEPLRGGAILGAGGVGVAADAESGGRGRRAAEGQPTTELLSNPAPHPAGSRDATGATLSAPAAGRSNLTTANRRPPAHEAKGKPKKEPGSPRAAAPASSSGTNTRFQCPRCPKNFSRIENLTRHQANHDEVGKFACPVCKKRFTRSDLLNRHRRIHGTATEAAYTATQVVKPETPSTPATAPDYRLLPQQLAAQQLKSQSEVSYSELPPDSGGMQASLGQDAYQPMLAQQDPLGLPNQINLFNNPVPAQGLSNLADAALSPAMGNPQYEALQISQSNTPNPSLWNGFMLDSSLTNYNGSYDADISWTLRGFNPESSPANVMDYDTIMNPPDGYIGNAYQATLPQLDQSIRVDLPVPEDQNDLDDADSKDWPDKPEDNVVALGQKTRSIPYRSLPQSWHPAVLEEARLSRASAPSILRHRVSPPIRSGILSSLNGAHFKNDVSKPEIGEASFPSAEVLDHFLQLYMQHVHPRFPVIHVPTFDIFKSPPLLLVSMMFLGSCHSKADRGRFWRLFYDHARIAFLRYNETEESYFRDMDSIFTFFLLCLGCAWSGTHRSFEFAEGSRGILITACRRSRLFDCRSPDILGSRRPVHIGNNPTETAWLSWIEVEKRKRLGCSIYIFDSQYPALFNNQGYIGKAETTNCAFPCADEFWEAPTAEDWKMLIGPDADEPPAIFYLHGLNCCLLRKWVKPTPQYPQLSEFGKIFLIYALHTHIFEWRQSTIMYNPTALKDALGNMGYAIGKSLQDRRKTIIDALDTWSECYQTAQTTPAAVILLHLGYISADVSLSDLHLMAGRSSSPHDQLFSQKNLTQWANSEGANTTMTHVFTMLNICHQCIAAGVEAQNSFEITVGLFTGGLVCWAYGQFCNSAPREEYLNQVDKASQALQDMKSWMMCTNFGKILSEGFKIAKNTP